jgi:hypothetical protein
MIQLRANVSSAMWNSLDDESSFALSMLIQIITFPQEFDILSKQVEANAVLRGVAENTSNLNKAGYCQNDVYKALSCSDLQPMHPG